MFEPFFDILTVMDDFLWSYVGLTFILISGAYFTAKCKGFQFKVLGAPIKTLRELHQSTKDQKSGTNPFKLYFASVGGMIGMGNMVGVVTALITGGPGALFWMWVAVFLGMIVKYAEIYLGVQYRVKNAHGGYDGGPMYYLARAFKGSFLAKAFPILVCILLCIYGVEIFQFVVIVDTLTDTFQVDRLVIVLVFLAATLYTGFGGVNRLANVCSVLMPIFMVLYVIMCSWVIFRFGSQLGIVLPMVFKSAFTGSAAMGGFAGSTVLLAAQQGISRAVYSGDIGIGYDSIIQSETQSDCPERQARLAIFGLFGDAFFSTLTMVTVLVTGLLWTGEGLKESQYIATALATTFPHIKFFMAAFFFLAGWTTIIGYVVVGTKSAVFLNPKYGKIAYLLFALVMFLTFSYASQTQVYLVMSVCGGLLMVVNLSGLLKLRKDIQFNKF